MTDIEIWQMLEWIEEAPGWFSVRDLTSDPQYMSVYTRKCETLVHTGHLIRHKDRRGMYRKKESDLEEMDFINAHGEPVNIWLPFGLSDMVDIYDGNMIIVAGAKSSGKTALMLNIVKENRYKDWNIHYFNSEMGANEFKRRLNLFYDVSITDWNFNAYRRGNNFSDVVFHGPENLNIIDFLEIHDEFYAVGRELKAIHDNLKGAIAIVGLQKNPGCEVGLGSWRSAEVARLYLSIDKGKIKITDAKNFKDPQDNPNGKVAKFTIQHGSQINAPKGWGREVKIKKEG